MYSKATRALILKKRVSPGFYNTEMESKYFWLYVSYKILSHKSKELADYDKKLIKFELQYYKVSKMNRILNEISQNKDEFIKYLEPTHLKEKVDNGAQKLGIIPYEKLDKKDDDFILL